MKQTRQEVFTAVLATLVIAIPASIIALIILAITRNNDAFTYTLLGACIVEILGWAWYFRTRPDPESEERGKQSQQEV